jgi:hypothetical protein
MTLRPIKCANVRWRMRTPNQFENVSQAWLGRSSFCATSHAAHRSLATRVRDEQQGADTYREHLTYGILLRTRWTITVPRRAALAREVRYR